MNITLFYHRMSLYYFKRAIALILLGVLISLLIPGLHILFYLVSILLGTAFVCMHFIYAKEVNRSRVALKALTRDINQYLIVNKDEHSYCFFSFDGEMKFRISIKRGIVELKIDDREIFMKRESKSIKVFVEGEKKYVFTGKNNVWNDTEGNRLIFIKKGEGWHLLINDAKVCSLTQGMLPMQKQQIFDPSSIVVRFEDINDALKQCALLFIVLLLEDYYVI
jgi:hypothetical protein